MTAKMRDGLNLPNTKGAEDGRPHARLMDKHRREGRPEGAPFRENVDDRAMPETGSYEKSEPFPEGSHFDEDPDSYGKRGYTG